MRKTIGTDPFDAVSPQASADGPKDLQDLRKPKIQTTKERLTVHMPVDLIERAKNAVYWTPGLTLAGMAEQAFAEILDRLEAERGEPFPQRREDLKGGRPIK